MEDFISLYREMLVTYRKPDKDKLDILRLKKLEAKVEQAYKQMEATPRAQVIRRLVEEDLAPKSWIDLMEVFGTVPVSIHESPTPLP